MTLSSSVWSCGRSDGDRLDQAHLLALDQRLYRAKAEVDQRLDVEGHRADLDPAGLDLGEVEDIVDERQEVLGADEDLLEVLVLSGREDVARAPHHEAAETDDGVQRGTELVGHAGEERRLVARGSLELTVQLLKLVGAHLDLDLQLLRVLADLREQPAALDRDGGLVRQRRKKAPVVLPELRRCPALDQKDPDHRLPRLERHGDLGPDPGGQHGGQVGTIRVLLRIVVNEDGLRRQGDAPADTVVTGLEAQLGQALAYRPAVGLHGERVALAFPEGQEALLGLEEVSCPVGDELERRLEGDAGADLLADPLEGLALVDLPLESCLVPPEALGHVVG